MLEDNTVIRIIHNRENPFVQLNKKALLNPNLSLKEVGLWARCMSKPDNWEFSIADIVQNSKEGRTAISSAINELIDQGYALKFQKKDDSYRFCKYEYYFFEFALSDEERVHYENRFKNNLPQAGFPLAGNQQQLITSIDTNIPKEINRYIQKEKSKEKVKSAHSGFSEKVERAKNVFTSAEEHEKLEKELGKKVLAICYQMLSDWKEITPRYKWKKGDYLSIKRWVINAYHEKNDKPEREKKTKENIEKNKIYLKKFVENFLEKRYQRDVQRMNGIIFTDRAFWDKKKDLSIAYSLELKEIQNILGQQYPEIFSGLQKQV